MKIKNLKTGVETEIKELNGKKNTFKMLDLSTALGNRGRYIYSVPLAIERVSPIDGMKINVEEEGSIYQYINIDKLIELYDKNEAKIEKNEKLQYFQSIKSFMKDLKISFGKIPPVEPRKKPTPSKIGEQKKLDPVKTSLDTIMSELAKIDALTMNRDEEVETKLKDAMAKLDVATKQLELAEAKYEEARKVNLDLVKQKDTLASEVNSLRKFKNGVLGLANEQK